MNYWTEQIFPRAQNSSKQPHPFYNIIHLRLLELFHVTLWFKIDRTRKALLICEMTNDINNRKDKESIAQMWNDQSQGIANGSSCY